ncbi:hypothetical protein DCC39_08735 [Pueribacillus theae]|uniref:RNA-binding protein KhpB N-terminal domain-containing protein n=1 Tax=Pueribacillus theae TaxID=2171751 RepID=A0A2U1K4F5_9BACI|nr:FapA family protein [Pueribacillus theae]PWA11863.1 hypothetical protein DCC39_08735 [Pueribacillus theae]
MNSIEAKGRNIQEAIDKALKELGATAESVTVEVLEEEEDRLFGLLVKPAVVKVTKKSVKESPEEPTEEKIQAGMIQLKDGRVSFHATETNKPAIIPSDELILQVNGKEIKEEIEVNEGDLVSIQGKEIAKEAASIDIRVSADKLSALLCVTPGYIEKTVPMDEGPAPTLSLKAKTMKEPIDSFSRDDIIAKLHKKGILYGIAEEAIDKACTLKEYGEITVANGLPPENGKNGFVEFFIDFEGFSLKPKKREDGTVDFRETNRIPTVEKGQAIGMVREPIEGKQGRTVENKALNPKQVKQAIVKGKGIILKENKIIAAETGTISVTIRPPVFKIDIIQKLVHRGDVDIKSGNLSFVGDIEIQGNVEETMSVKAEEKILITGSVHGGHIAAGTALTINKNIIRGKILVGQTDEIEQNLKEETKELRHVVHAFHKALLGLLVAQRKKGQMNKLNLSLIINILLKQKFPTLQNQINNYLSLLQKRTEKGHPDEQAIEILLKKVFVASNENAEIDETIFLTIEEKLDALAAFYEELFQPFASATISSAQQSDVYCNGDIYLTGRGAYNTKFKAEGSFTATGFIRGGTVEARNGIIANEVGSGFGVKTELIVPKDKTITIAHAMEDTVIQIGKRMYCFEKERKNVLAVLDETGEIVFR